jgi:ecotin
MTMIRQILHWLTIGLLFSSLPVIATEHTQMKAFPEAEQGMLRFVIELPHKERDEEQDYKVELLAGREMQTDGVNQIRLGSSIEAQPLKGWGYTYYEVKEVSAAISTMMAAPEGTPKVMQFVTTAPLLIRYNSRLPIVVYVPEGYEVRYRIWAAPDDYRTANQN